MKRWLMAFALWVVPAVVSAAPSITLRLGGGVALTEVEAGQTCAKAGKTVANCQTSPEDCGRAEDAGRLVPVVPSAGATIECEGAAAGAAAVSVPVKVEEGLTTGTIPAAQDPTTGVFTWLGWANENEKVVAENLGLAGLQCFFEKADAKDCNLMWTRANGGYRLQFSYTGTKSAGNRVTVANADKKRAVTLPLDPCVFTASSPSQLYRSLNAQELILTANKAGCTSMLRPGDVVTMTAGAGNVVSGRVERQPRDVRDGDQKVFAQFTSIPTTLTAGATDFVLRRGSDFIGNAQVRVSDAACDATHGSTGAPALSVTYGFSYLDQWHDKKSEGIAVASSVNDLDIDELPAIHNVAHLEMPDEFTERPLRDKKVRWRISTQTWKGLVWFYDYSKDTWLSGEKPIITDTVSEIGFAVTKSRNDPFDVLVELIRCSKEFDKHQDDGRDTCEDPLTLLSRTVRLATSARVESLPLPLAPALEVVCGDPKDIGNHFWPKGQEPAEVDVAQDGTVRAIENAHLETGMCRLYYEPREILKPLSESLPSKPGGYSKKYLKAALEFFGQQELEVTVRRGDAATKSTVWSLDTNTSQYVVLPDPGGKSAIGLYHVDVRTLGPQSPQVVYRSQPAASGPQAARTTSRMEFHAGLRPRGNQGWRKAPIRTFITFPVDFVGYRFPASPRDLRSSQSSTVVESIGARAGVLFGVEPWNYDAGSNPWAIPTRFLTGLHIVDLTRGGLAPSWVTGVALTLPVIDPPKGASQDALGTDVALGFFWEVDLNERSPFKNGSHFVTTLGVNLLSLFGGR